MNQTKSLTTHNSHVSEMTLSKSLARSDVNVDYEPLLLEGQCADETHVPTISELKMRSDSQLAGYVISSVLEPKKDDDSEPEGSLTCSIATKDPAASSFTK